MMITSTQNPKIKWVRELQTNSKTRRSEGLFVVEGVRLVEEALVARWPVRLVLYSNDLSERGQKLLERIAVQGVPIEQVADYVLAAASDTQTPQGVLAVMEQCRLMLPDILDFVFIPDQVRDPGNLGTMLRTAAAAGVQAVFIPPDTTDAFAPKVVRAGMGAHFRLPIYTLSWDEIVRNIPNLEVYLAAAGEGRAYTQVDWCAPCALVVGGEADGPSRAALNLADQRVHIPMTSGSESLNAAMAAGILFFEVVRQRTAKP